MGFFDNIQGQIKNKIQDQIDKTKDQIKSKVQDSTGKIKQKIAFSWDGAGMVSNCIKRWKPSKCTSEKDFEKSLYDFLHDELGDMQITKQYAKGRIRADLAVGDKVILELKFNLDTTAKYQRLIGQINDYKDWGGGVIIVLTGTTDKNLRKKLDKDIRSFSGDALGDTKIMIVDK